MGPPPEPDPVAGSNRGHATTYVERAFGADRWLLRRHLGCACNDPCPVELVVFEGRKPPTVDSADARLLRRWLQGGTKNVPCDAATRGRARCRCIRTQRHRTRRKAAEPDRRSDQRAVPEQHQLQCRAAQGHAGHPQWLGLERRPDRRVADDHQQDARIERLVRWPCLRCCETGQPLGRWRARGILSV